MIVYHINPIDCWTGWLKSKQFVKRSFREYDLAPRDLKEFYDVLWDIRARIDQRFWKAKEQARKIGWEGDISCGPYFSAIPTSSINSEYLIAWKQYNNGSTFVASPFRLSWLENDCYMWIDENGKVHEC
jgi:hypothetical protein